MMDRTSTMTSRRFRSEIIAEPDNWSRRLVKAADVFVTSRDVFQRTRRGVNTRRKDSVANVDSETMIYVGYRDGVTD